ANLAHDSFDHDFAQVLQRARAAGVGTIIITGSDAGSARKALALAREHAGLYATAGLHPHHASDWSADTAALFEQLAQDEKLVALGECGLDYFRDFSPRDVQRSAFAAQLELAARLRRPLFLHQRDAHVDFLPILREHRAALAEVVVHCYTDTRAALAEYLALDCHIGITGWVCDQRRGSALREIVRDIPDERLLIETDAPYLLPHTAPKSASRRNEPCFLPYVVETLAAQRGQSVEHVARITARNARDFFRLPEPKTS
ncbi:MAG TPA: TatD family hydrolase, partial [Nevskiaceae bacterium]|nr:TatD family hydrolase [Nevskiaceae bacterium]